MEYKEFTGKTVEEAIENGLKELNVSRESVEIRVLEEGKKKLFGSVKARVEIAVKTERVETVKETVCVAESLQTTSEPTDGERAVEFLNGLFKVLKIEAVTSLVSENEKIEINVAAANTNEVIGKRGATIDAIQTLASAVANTGRDKYVRVVVDCENYRETREATLKRLAENLAQKAIRFEKKLCLEPMNPYERRIIHATLSEFEGIKTQSEGKEPNRYIVIIPDNVADPDAPAMPVRNERRSGNDRRGYDRNSRGGRNGNRNGGSKGGYNKKPYNRSGNSNNKSAGGTTMKNMDFFGTFLGNSNKDN
jgi:spoIIIJ-associated protein